MAYTPWYRQTPLGGKNRLSDPDHTIMHSSQMYNLTGRIWRQ
jgi:hypothetical protein